MVLLEQLGLNAEASTFEEFLQILQHALADAGNSQHLLGFANNVANLLGMILNRLRRVAVRTDAKRILPIDFQQVGSFVQNRGDGFIVHH